MDAGLRMKKLNVDGMTCISCQNKIENKLKKLEGVQKVDVSYKTGIVEIIYQSDIVSIKEIKAVIERLDYRVVHESEKKHKHITRTGITLLLIIFLYFLLQNFGILNMLVPSQLADTKMGYGMLFVIGLITSVHCIAMCGGINLSVCIPRGAEAGGENQKYSIFFPALLYNLGRVISYTVIGGILGFVGFLIGGGSDVGVPVLLQGILKLIAGIFMVIMGINMLGLFPWLRRFQPHLPYGFVSKFHTSNKNNNSPLIVGLLNGLMPCGPLQAMQIVALASGNPFSGAFSMFLFSLGTVPLMLGFGSFVSVLGKKFTHQVMNVGAVLVVVLGLAMLSQGGLLSGMIAPNTLFLVIIELCVIGMLSIFPYKKQIHKQVVLSGSILLLIVSLVLPGMIILWSVPNTQTEMNIETETNTQVVEDSVSENEDVQYITSSITNGSYDPITVQQGIPVKWTLNVPAGSLNGCNSSIVIPEYNLQIDLAEGDNLIEFTPTQSGTYSFSCWMGMIRSSITVLEAF